MEICSKKGTKTRKEEIERGEREKTKRREKKVRGTAQESFSHEAQKNNKKTTPITTYSKDRVVNISPSHLLLS